MAPNYRKQARHLAERAIGELIESLPPNQRPGAVDPDGYLETLAEQTVQSHETALRDTMAVVGGYHDNGVPIPAVYICYTSVPELVTNIQALSSLMEPTIRDGALWHDGEHFALSVAELGGKRFSITLNNLDDPVPEPKAFPFSVGPVNAAITVATVWEGAWDFETWDPSQVRQWEHQVEQNGGSAVMILDRPHPMPWETEKPPARTLFRAWIGRSQYVHRGEQPRPFRAFPRAKPRPSGEFPS